MSVSNKQTNNTLRVLLIACMLVGALVNSNVYASQINVIALFGDSITVGENNSFPFALRPGRGNGRLANDGGSPALPPSDKLDTLLIDERRISSVVNWGRGGSSSSNGAGRISADLGTTRSAYSADNYYVLIMYGTNDFNVGLSESDTAFNTRLMIDRARSAGFIPVIGTLTPRIDRNLSSLNGRIVAAANSRGVPIVDHFSRFNQDGNNGLTLLDVENLFGRVLRLHPTSEGYDVIARTWFDQFLKDAIEPEPVAIAPIINLILDD